jgi:apolipoprotein N-acyltransferase
MDMDNIVVKSIAKSMGRLVNSLFCWANVSCLAMSGLTVLCYAALFPPIELSFLAWVALVPWLLCMVFYPARRHLPISYIAGLAFSGITVWWILPITIPGYVSLCLYLACYWLLAAWMIHRLIGEHNVPAFVAVPVVWVGCEYLRTWVITSFPWFFLGHSQVKFLPMIQIADLVGAYGVSFVVAMVNGLAVDSIRLIYLRRGQMRRIGVGVSVTAGVFFGTLIYGYFRLGQDTIYSGPKLAVIQEDYPLTVEGDPQSYEMFRDYLQFSRAAGEEHPAMIIWPETCVSWPVNPEFLNASPEQEPDQSKRDRLRRMQRSSRDVLDILSEHATKAGAYLIVGSLSEEYSASRRYNSAIILDPDGTIGGRYDKIHLVLFGEFVPFRYTWPRLYRFLNENMTPYGRDGFEYSLTHGDINGVNRFELKSSGRSYRYAIAICYEDTMAYLIRRFARPENGKKQIDFLVNISNDGWFNHSCELPQHLYICAFRAVENRIGIARSVNTGISGFINPNGEIEQVVTDPAGRTYGEGVRGYCVQNIKLDTRTTVYSRLGDWFAIMCFIISLAAAVKVESWSAWIKKYLFRSRELL